MTGPSCRRLERSPRHGVHPRRVHSRRRGPCCCWTAASLGRAVRGIRSGWTGRRGSEAAPGVPTALACRPASRGPKRPLIRAPASVRCAPAVWGVGSQPQWVKRGACPARAAALRARSAGAVSPARCAAIEAAMAPPAWMASAGIGRRATAAEAAICELLGRSADVAGAERETVLDERRVLSLGGGRERGCGASHAWAGGAGSVAMLPRFRRGESLMCIISAMPPTQLSDQFVRIKIMLTWGGGLSPGGGKDHGRPGIHGIATAPFSVLPRRLVSFGRLPYLVATVSRPSFRLWPSSTYATRPDLGKASVLWAGAGR